MISNQLHETLDGIIPRAVHEVFGHMSQIAHGVERMKVSMSFLEIYNEEARDLLSEDPSPPELLIRDSADGDVVVQNLSFHKVASPHEVSSLMETAAGKRSTAATLMNAVSSRSHAICTLYITIAPLPDHGDEDEITAKLTLVDLAGSERAKKTGAEGTRLKEGININKGLFVLGQVVSALAELGQQIASDSSTIHVKYRDSKLTRLLQDSLGGKNNGMMFKLQLANLLSYHHSFSFSYTRQPTGNSKTVMVACVSPADSNIDETVNTLRYAERTRSIKNAAIRNVVATPLTPAEVAALRRENQMLKLQLFQAQAKVTSMSSRTLTSPLLSMPNLSSTTTSTSDDHAHAHAHASTAYPASHGIVDNELNGLNLNNLDIVTKLKMHCSSMEEKIDDLESKSKSAVEDSLDASLRADKWQLRCENLMAILKSNDISLPDDLKKDGTVESANIVSDLRNEIVDLKDQLRESIIDAEVSRSIAAIVMNGNKDIDTTETMSLVSGDSASESFEEDEKHAHFTQALSEELVSMSGSIEHKEAMMLQMNNERECMEAMRSHFESAITSLQEEVGILSSERDNLVGRLGRDNGSKDDDLQTRRLQERTKALEVRIKELQQKAAEHTKCLRLQSQAEKKCQQLQAELTADKKRRGDLQRKLKETSVERLNEQKHARLTATKLLRDSQRLKLELNRVKDAAAKQENVLRRKAAESMHRQKLLAERTKKRGRAAGGVTSDLTSQRKEEINSFIEREISNGLSLQNLRGEIEENNRTLQETEEKREVVFSQQTNNEESTVIRTLDAEIDLRSKISEQLEKNIGEIYKSANRNPKTTDKYSSKFLELSFWQGLSRPEIRYVSQIFFAKLIEQQHECETLNSSQKSTTVNEVAKALEKERRAKNKELMTLKVQHSEDIVGLLQSTKAALQRDVYDKIATSISTEESSLDSETKARIDNMLNEYLASYTEIGTKVRTDLETIKASQDGMKRLVDGMADEMISQNEAKAMLAAQKKKKTKPVVLETEEVFESDDENRAGAGEDGDDSDWSPDTPMPSKKKQRSSDEAAPVYVYFCEFIYCFYLTTACLTRTTFQQTQEDHDATANQFRGLRGDDSNAIKGVAETEWIDRVRQKG